MTSTFIAIRKKVHPKRTGTKPNSRSNRRSRSRPFTLALLASATNPIGAPLVLTLEKTWKILLSPHAKDSDQTPPEPRSHDDPGRPCEIHEWHAPEQVAREFASDREAALKERYVFLNPREVRAPRM